jgi:hypothetical protein
MGAVSASASTQRGRSGSTQRPPTVRTVQGHSLLQSRELWATVDVCNPADKPNTVGIRGSMPADGHPKDAMYMRFQLQYLEAKTSHWVNLTGGNSGFLTIGAAKSARQGGWSVQLMPTKGASGDTIRGLVTFQWRHAGATVHETTRTTEAGHDSLADADPAGYSAAQCTIS